jgi:hypothetical protein
VLLRSKSNSTGDNNTAIGLWALYSNATGGDNTSVGVKALFNNTSGNGNTAVGELALSCNTTGSSNTANGVDALALNTTGIDNTATGEGALFSNTTGSSNTANGVNALFSNTAGQGNTASGFNALKSNTTAFNNTAAGQSSLSRNTTGGSNTANGFGALLNNTTGSSNITLGANAGANLTTGSNNIDIGNRGVAGEGNAIRIGTTGTHTSTFVAGIRGVTVATGIGVIVGSNGQLGTVTSSDRFKEVIKPMDKASEKIRSLRPVTFRYKHELDPDGIPQFGLVAEQVEKVNSDLVVRDDDGKVMSVRYDAVNAMLLNEFLKEHRKVQELEANEAQQQKEITLLKAELKDQAAQIQKVSAQLEASKPAPQVVNNNQ